MKWEKKIFKSRIRTTFLAALLMATFLILPQNARTTTDSGQLIVFVQPNSSSVDDVFLQRSLPEIRKIADAMGVSVHVVDASKGSPIEVALTPLIVYQNYRGRSVYQGRTTTPARIRNFMRTSRFVPQGKERNRRENIPVWTRGRSRVWAPLKVAPISGKQPADYDHDAFVAQALKSIAGGFKKFDIQKLVELDRADRGFYMDFNPWLSDDGNLFITVVVFSQFDCKTPVFSKKIIGPWKKYQKLFRQASAAGEEAVVRIAADPASGDSFDPVKKTAPRKSWEQIGFPLPPAPKMKTAQTAVSAVVPQKWILTDSGPDDPPMIQFRFPAPLDNYAGEVKSGRGEFSLSQNRMVSGAQGFVEIDTRGNITMGDPRLDEAIQGRIMLYTKKFPATRFDIEKISGEDQPIAYGRLSPAFVAGKFSLKGKSIPLTSMTQIEPVMGEDGRPRLLVSGSFKIDLRTFNIEGADGPAPARHMLLFDLNLILKER
jgi:polyisoprenoid-binding protein YceI